MRVAAQAITRPIIFTLLLGAVGGAVAVFVAAGSSVSPRTAACFPPSAIQLTKIRSMALAVAAWADDPHPTSGRVWSTTRRVANRLAMDANVDSDQPVFVVVLQGNFSDASAPLPEGATARRYPVVVNVWDPERNVGTDFGLRFNDPSLTALGSGIDLRIPCQG